MIKSFNNFSVDYLQFSLKILLTENIFYFCVRKIQEVQHLQNGVGQQEMNFKIYTQINILTAVLLIQYFDIECNISFNLLSIFFQKNGIIY